MDLSPSSPQRERLAHCRVGDETFNFYQTSLPGPFLLRSTNMVLMTLTDGRHILMDDNFLPNLRYFNFHRDIKHLWSWVFINLTVCGCNENNAVEDFPCCHTLDQAHFPGCVKSLTAKHAHSSILSKARTVMSDLSYSQMQGVTPVLQSRAVFKVAVQSLADFHPMAASLDMVQEQHRTVPCRCCGWTTNTQGEKDLVKWMWAAVCHLSPDKSDTRYWPIWFTGIDVTYKSWLTLKDSQDICWDWDKAWLQSISTVIYV